MSIRVMTLVWESTIPAPERFTLLALADMANDHGVCWPSQQYLMRKCVTSESTIRRHIRSLESDGILSLKRRGDTSSLYTLSLGRLRQLAQPPLDDPTEATGQSDRSVGDGTTGQSDRSRPVNLTDGTGQSDRLTVIEPPGEPKDPSSPAVAVDAAVREDVAALCQRMMERLDLLEIKRPGTKHPSGFPEEWRKQARLLLDVDKRELAKALNLLDWATVDVFWSRNIHSIPTFRKQYDKLRVAALKQHAERNGTTLRSVPTPPPATFEDLVEAADVEAARRLIRANYLMPDHLPGNPMTFAAWRRHCAREWITQHEASIRAALEQRKAHA